MIRQTPSEGEKFLRRSKDRKIERLNSHGVCGNINSVVSASPNGTPRLSAPIPAHDSN